MIHLVYLIGILISSINYQIFTHNIMKSKIKFINNQNKKILTKKQMKVKQHNLNQLNNKLNSPLNLHLYSKVQYKN